MIKILLIVLIPVVIVGGLIFLLSSRPNAILPKEVPLYNSINSDSSSSSVEAPLPTAKDSSIEERVKTLEAAVGIINKKIDVLTATLGKSSVNTTSVVTTPSPTTVAASSSNAKSVYIPIGYGGSSTSSSDFESIGSQQITIDTADYPGYKQAVLEVNFKVTDGNGQGQARLFNSTDGLALSGSDISTSSGSFSTVSSSSFNLSSGSKAYTLQLKSLTGYQVDVQLARIRIDF